MSAYNQELCNRPFTEKRERFAQSNIGLTRELAHYRKWGQSEIQERGRRLAAEAARTWIGPKEPFVERAPRGDSQPGGGDDPRELRTRFWSGLSDYMVEEHPDLPAIRPRPNWTIRLPSGIRHVGVELRLNFRHDKIAIDMWFWRQASFPLWESIREAPGPYNELAGEVWKFGRAERHPRGWMSMERRIVGLRNPSSWPEAYGWFLETTPLVLEGIAPKLREEMNRAEAKP